MRINNDISQQKHDRSPVFENPPVFQLRSPTQLSSQSCARFRPSPSLPIRLPARQRASFPNRQS